MEGMYLADAHAHISSEEVFHEVPLSFVNIIGYAIPDLVPQQLYSDTVTQPTNRDAITYLEYCTGIAIHSLDTYIQALDQYLENEIASGIVGFKWHITSFMRENQFDIVSEYDAQLCLDAEFITTGVQEIHERTGAVGTF